MKKIIITLIALISVGFLWFDLLAVDAKVVEESLNCAYIDSQRAVICAVAAAVAGIIIFLWRHREKLGR